MIDAAISLYSRKEQYRSTWNILRIQQCRSAPQASPTRAINPVKVTSKALNVNELGLYCKQD